MNRSVEFRILLVKRVLIIRNFIVDTLHSVEQQKRWWNNGDKVGTVRDFNLSICRDTQRVVSRTIFEQGIDDRQHFHRETYGLNLTGHERCERNR